MIDELVQYKRTHYPADDRRILVCGMVEDNVHVEWLPAASPGVDSRSQMTLYGLMRAGEREEAIRHLRSTQRMPRHEAALKVDAIAAELGIP